MRTVTVHRLQVPGTGGFSRFDSWISYTVSRDKAVLPEILLETLSALHYHTRMPSLFCLIVSGNYSISYSA